MTKSCALAILLSAVLSAAALAAPAAPYLVKDVNLTVPENVGSLPVPLGIAGRWAVFVTSNGQLWASDGTAAGTHLLLDADPNRARSKDGEAGAKALTSAGGRLFFLFKGGGPRELWATDGTPQGTVQLAVGTLLRDPQTSPGYYYWSNALRILFFTATDTAHGQEPWVSDGTLEGTHVLDLRPGPDSTSPSSYADAGSSVIIQIYGDAHTPLLWRSDGTEAGTVPVQGTEQLSGYDFVSIGRKAVFSVFGSTTMELWATDGTGPGTTRLTRITGAGEDWDLLFLGATFGRLYFYTSEGKAGYRLWTTDGTSAGTRVLSHFSRPSYEFGNPQGFNFLPNGIAMLFLDDGVHGLEWWRSDGTVAGTRLVKDVCPGKCGSFSFLVGRPLVVGNKLFVHLFGQQGMEPWMSDGTAAGTRQIADTCPGKCGSVTYLRFALGRLELYSAKSVQEGSDVIDLWRTDGTSSGTFRLVQSKNAKNFIALPGIALGNQLLFLDDDGVHGAELWTTDGTIKGTHFVADLAGSEPAGSAPSQITPVGSRVFFVADDGIHGQALWVSDGTAAGTSLVHAFDNPPPYDPRYSGPFSNLTAWNGKLIFALAEGTSYPRLWVSDGTAQGTQRLSDAIQLDSVPFMPLGNRLLASASDGLWITDGTPGGTVLMAPHVSLHGSFAPLGNQLLFSGRQGFEGDGLWKTDGTAAGTVQVKAMSMGYSNWVILGGTLYFTDGGGSLWATDGTAEGTRLLDVPVSGISALAGAGGRLFLVKSDSGPFVFGPFALWVSDGTAAGSTKLLEIPASPYGQRFRDLTVVGSQVFFVVDDGVHGQELWRSDGTAAGTFMVQDINPGVQSSAPSGLAAAGGILYFNSYEGVHGQELWQSDGTPGGTFLLSDLAPGPRSSSPQSLVLAGPRLFFNSDDGVHGQELWALCLLEGGCGGQ